MHLRGKSEIILGEVMEIHKDIPNGECEPIEVYRCSYCEDGKACGFDGEGYDHSHDECHHPFSLDEARRIAACWNYCISISTEELERRVRFRYG